MVVYKALNTTIERRTTDAGHGVGDVYASKATTTRKRPTPDAGHGIGNGDARQAATIGECTRHDVGHNSSSIEFWNYDGSIVVIFMTKHTTSSVIKDSVLYTLVIRHSARKYLFNVIKVFPYIRRLIGSNAACWNI